MANESLLPGSQIKVKKLEWTVWEGHFGNDWLCQIPSLNRNYSIWIDRTTGKTVVSGLDLKKSEHNSVQEAKDWCQRNFESVLKSFFEKEVSNG